MSDTIKIGTMSYRVEPLEGRLFLNRREVGAICDHDEQIIRYSTDLPTHSAVLAVADAVSAACCDAAQANRLFPHYPEKSIAADGPKFHGPDQQRRP